MKIVHINYFDNKGGAGKAAFRLHESLKKSGCESKILVDYKFSNSEDVRSVDERGGWRRNALRLINLGESFTGLQYLCPRPNGFLSDPFLSDARVIHLHNIHGGFFSLSALSQLTERYPVVWTLHDMWGLTGHCGYAYDCNRWETGCGSCPYLNEYPPLKVDRTSFLWKQKEKIYRRSRLTLVSPSQWLRDLIKKSPLLRNFEVRVIPYGVDLKVFRPVDREEARKELNLPKEAFIILFGAAFAAEERKGKSFITEVLSRLSQNISEKIFFAEFGSAFEDLNTSTGIPKKIFGVVQDEKKLAMLYSAADVFICPSLADNLPNTVLESLACGTPVVGFNVGGIPETIQHLKTGYLARYRDVHDLVSGIQYFVREKDHVLMTRAHCRQFAEAQYSLEHEVKEHLSLYLEVINQRNAHE